MIFLEILLVILFILVGIYFFLYQKVRNHRPENYPNPENRAKIDHSKKIIVCFGDSNTHGNVSHNWVDDLAAELPNYQVFNAGINADLSYTLLNRIDDVFACQPDFISILIGTNDVNFTMGKAQEKHYYDLRKIDKNTRPDFESYQQNLTKIVAVLKEKTNAKIALMSLPVMGEDLSHEANQKADKYSEFIKQLADNEQVIYLPLREKQQEFLQKNQKKLKHTFEETYKLMNFSVALHYLFGKSWDSITKAHGNQLSPDNLHQNSLAASMICSLVRAFILEK